MTGGALEELGGGREMSKAEKEEEKREKRNRKEERRDRCQGGDTKRRRTERRSRGRRGGRWHARRHIKRNHRQPPGRKLMGSTEGLVTPTISHKVRYPDPRRVLNPHTPWQRNDTNQSATKLPAMEILWSTKKKRMEHNEVRKFSGKTKLDWS